MSASKIFRLGLLGSGKGSNAAAIADACASGQIPAQVAIVLSDVADAGILRQARQRGLPAVYIPPGNFAPSSMNRPRPLTLARCKKPGWTWWRWPASCAF